ncbi:squalene--hopene cyclase [Bacillus dakarensis]|uniref:squalene--hopene cyclase n=1 Tax=Robertmurraya dakarensis TaxID=1926278 RepID=UPI000981160B|nr:squalene--hopene cyclase [Bacillus dakarensis]
MEKRIKDGMNSLIDKLRGDQHPDGTWRYPFETGISTDCYMIILLRTLEIDDENLIKGLSERILSKQEENGAWKLFYDEQGEGNVTATIEAYYALLYSGYFHRHDARLKMARKFILAHGGMEGAHMLTKIMLALTGQYKWPAFFPIPVEMILLPPTFPIHFYSFSVFGRANLTPIMILSEKKYSLKNKKSPDLSDLYTGKNREQEDLAFDEEWRSVFSTLSDGIKCLIGLPQQLKKMAIEQAEQYMLRHTESDGTFYSYFSSTFLMIFALLSLEYPKNHPAIMKAVEGLKDMKCEIDGLPHMQYTSAAVWNTSLINTALQEAGVTPDDSMIKKANGYLLKRQHSLYGDWAINNPHDFPGGWGFSDINTFNPDVDDTTASLRSLSRMVPSHSAYRQAWERGVLWVLSMQNDDGGWPAFEKNTNSSLLKFFPIEKAEFILADPPSGDLTGRTLEFLGRYTNLPKHHPSVEKGKEWLFHHQEKDGSWYGRWGICFIYGTWAALTGLMAVGVLPTHRRVSKAVAWLEGIQNRDGGWGESCKSDSKNKYVPLGASTLTHTAWAVDALISACDQPTKAIKAGVEYLLKNLERDDWTTNYPKGQGMAGDFYIHYHSYRYIFPLLALGSYLKKF